MLAYGILDGDAEIIDMTISALALAQLCAGNVGINSANVGISSFALLTAITHLYAKRVKPFYSTRNPILNHTIASDQKYNLPEKRVIEPALASDT